GTGKLTRTVLPQANAYAMIRRRATAAGIATKLGNHSFRATGITAYLKNGGTLEKTAAMANHASRRTTQLYDRRPDEPSLDEVERIVICLAQQILAAAGEELVIGLQVRAVHQKRGLGLDLAALQPHCLEIADQVTGARRGILGPGHPGVEPGHPHLQIVLVLLKDRQIAERRQHYRACGDGLVRAFRFHRLVLLSTRASQPGANVQGRTPPSTNGISVR